MERFYTEKQTEAFLEDETRILSLPDGSRASVTAFRLTWEAFDLMDATKAFSHQELIDWSYEWQQLESQHDFATCFKNMVAFAFSEVKRQRYGQ